MSDNKVVSIEDAKKKREDELKERPDFDFGDIMEKNAKNKERVRQERAKDNRSVTRSYRLKK